MKGTKPLDDTRKSLLQSFDEIAGILKAIGHPNRFKILILLLAGPQSFQKLLDETKLKKTALANHLTHLKGQLLIEKMHHGTYSITRDGKRYIQAIESVYEQSRVRELKEREAQQKYLLTKSFLERNKEILEKESKQRYEPAKSFLERKKLTEDNEN